MGQELWNHIPGIEDSPGIDRQLAEQVHEVHAANARRCERVERRDIECAILKSQTAWRRPAQAVPGHIGWFDPPGSSASSPLSFRQPGQSRVLQGVAGV